MIKCQFENGSPGFLRHVTVDSIVIDGDKILLVKRAFNLTNPNKYSLPGGFLGRDETTEEAALREVLEETGYQARVISLFRINDNPNRPQEDRQNVDFVYLLEAKGKVAQPDKESSSVDWFQLNNLPLPRDFAFDHYGNVDLYLKYLKAPFPLPFIGSLKSTK